jgi:UDP-N-acetylglucosamine enolpyruvyl transferase
MQPRAIIASDKSTRRTAILRISSQADLATLIADITAAGSSIVSEGSGVIVVEGTGQAIEKLRKHKYVITIDEPQRLQMRRPPKTRGNDDSDRTSGSN